MRCSGGLEAVVCAALLAGCGDTENLVAAPEAARLDKPTKQRDKLVPVRRHIERADAETTTERTPAQDEAAKRLQDAREQARLAETAASEDRWNDALRLVDQLDQAHRDEATRTAIGIDELMSRIVEGRNVYFRHEMPADLFRLTDELMNAKASERCGTLAAALQWQSRDFYVQLWETIAADKGLQKEELEMYWKNRTVDGPRTASYGAGTFVAMKKAPDAAGQAETHEWSLTEEHWWEAASASQRSQWLTAHFVETSGLYEILRIDETNCTTCNGAGQYGSKARLCPDCNGCGKVRTVTYR